jgi:DNA-binding FrmR family transcriptional regulator
MKNLDLEKSRTNIKKRVHYAQGHLNAVNKMIEKDANCLDIINQSHAVIEALKKINQLILEGHLGVCAWNAVHSKDATKREKAISELISLYRKN